MRVELRVGNDKSFEISKLEADEGERKHILSRWTSVVHRVGGVGSGNLGGAMPSWTAVPFLTSLHQNESHRMTQPSQLLTSRTRSWSSSLRHGTAFDSVTMTS